MQKISLDYIAGVIDKSCSFEFIVRRKPKYAIGFHAEPIITMIHSDGYLLNLILKTLKIGRVRKRADGYWEYRIYKEAYCRKFVEMFHDKLHVKKKTLRLFSQALRICENQEHRTEKGLLKLLKLRERLQSPHRDATITYETIKKLFQTDKYRMERKKRRYMPKHGESEKKILRELSTPKKLSELAQSLRTTSTHILYYLKKLMKDNRVEKMARGYYKLKSGSANV